MQKFLYKYIFLFISFKLFFICFVPASASLSAQSDEDSISVLNELSLDDQEEAVEPESESSEIAYDDFIKKEDRYTDWQPSLQKNIPDSVVLALKKEDAFWYADLAAEKKKKVDERKQEIPSWVRTLIWIVIIGGFAFFLITYLAGSNVGLFRKKNIIISEEDAEAMPEDIFAINYQKEIDKADAAGNYRLAVRLMFLQLLKNMSEQNIINYKQDKTNFDYLSELYNTNWYKQFFTVTRNYEYTWYGQFELSKEVYQLIGKDFDQFENQLS